jgi:hypothetical protein
MTNDTANEAQEIQFRRLELCEYIGGDGRGQGMTVANDLRIHKDLWDSFVFGRFERLQLIELRDLPAGILNVDTLFIKTTIDRADALRAVILENIQKIIAALPENEVAVATVEAAKV